MRFSAFGQKKSRLVDKLKPEEFQRKDEKTHRDITLSGVFRCVQVPSNLWKSVVSKEKTTLVLKRENMDVQWSVLVKLKFISPM